MDPIDLPFPAAAGCAGARVGAPPGRHPCPVAPVGTVRHRPAEPRARTARLFVCEAHAVGRDDPLTVADRAELRRRRAAARRRPDAARPVTPG